VASAVQDDRKYDEGVYRYKKPVVDISDINIEIGNRIFIGEELYGTIVKESELFYYIQKENVSESYEFQKTSILDKIANKVLILKD